MVAVENPVYLPNPKIVNSAVDTNIDDSIFTFSSIIRGPDAAVWLVAHRSEIVRLIEQGNGTFVRHADNPKDEIAF